MVIHNSKVVEFLTRYVGVLLAGCIFLQGVMFSAGCTQLGGTLSDEYICELARNPDLRASFANDPSLVDSLIRRIQSPPEGEAGRCFVFVMEVFVPPPHSKIKEALAQVDFSAKSMAQAKTLSFLQIAYADSRDTERLRHLLTSVDPEIVSAYLNRIDEMADKPVALLPEIVGLLETADIGLLQSVIATVAFYDGHAVAYIDAVRGALRRIEDYANSRQTDSQRNQWLKTLANYRVSYLERLIAFRDGVPPPQDRQFLTGGQAYEAGYRRPEIEASWGAWVKTREVGQGAGGDNQEVGE